MASYQPPNEQTAIFNSQNFTTSYSGQHDPTKMDYPVAQGTPVVPSLLVTSGGNSQTITSTGIGNVLTAQIPQLNTTNAFTANQTVTSGGFTSTLSGNQLSTTDGSATLTIKQIPQLNTANTFTSNQTLSGSANVIGASTIGTAGFSNTFIGNSSNFQHNISLSNSVINMGSRNYLGYYLGIAPVAISGSVSGVGTTTMTTSNANPNISVGTAILGTGVTTGTIVTAVNSSTSFTLNQNLIGTATTYLLPTGSNIVQIVSINNGTAGVSGTTMTITSLGLTLPVGTFIFGTGVATGTRISAITSSTVYTVSVASVISSVINGSYIIGGSYNVGYSTASIYYITPSSTNAYSICLPPIQVSNIGATTTFRVVNINTTVGADVTLIPTAGSNIFNGTSSAGIASHTIYTGNSTTILSHTFMALPTALTNGVNGYGWFQLGTV